MTQHRQPGLTDDAVIVECDLDQQPETVWRALTVPELVSEWLGPNTLGSGTHEPFEVQLAPEEGGSVACRVLEAVPCERLSYSWISPGRDLVEQNNSVVTFELTRTATNGTRLRILHTRDEAILSSSPVTMMGARRTRAHAMLQGRSGRRAISRPDVTGRRHVASVLSLPRAA
jgi:uncharacterized protein YndB with AHSA1/START domain